MLERHEIDTFLTLVDELHFGRTAERLRVTPARVSQTIKKMERQIGAALFERTSRQVSLTLIGKRLADDLKPLIVGVHAAMRRAIEAGRGITGTLRVGYLSATAGQLLLKAVSVFAAKYPDCEIHIHEVQGHEAVARLRKGDIDVLITDLLIAAFPDLTPGPVLLTESRMLAVSANDPLARCSSVSLEVLANYPVIGVPPGMPEEFELDRNPRITPDGKHIPRGPRADTFTETLTIIAAGRGVFPVGEQAARYHPRPDIAYIPIDDGAPIRWGPMWLRTNTTERIRAFVETSALAHGRTPASASGLGISATSS